MTSRKIEDLVPELQPLCRELLARCRAEGINAFITCTYRSPAEQAKLYAQGRTTPGKIVTNAKAGQSKHNVRKAFDIAIKTEDGSLNWDTSHEHWRRVGEIGEELGLEWGGRWPKMRDYPHFQIT